MFSYMNQGKKFYKEVAMLAIPMVLQNMVTTSLGLLDSFMVGLLGEAPLAAVTMANTPVMVIMLMTFGLQSGGSVLMSQFYGKGDYDSINRVLGIGFYAAAAVKLIVLPLMTAAILLLLPIRFEFNFFVAIVILSGAPCAGITSMMAEKYGKDAERSAQLVSLSNLLSIVTLPVVTVLAETLAG